MRKVVVLPVDAADADAEAAADEAASAVAEAALVAVARIEEVVGAVMRVEHLIRAARVPGVAEAEIGTEVHASALARREDQEVAVFGIV